VQRKTDHKVRGREKAGEKSGGGYTWRKEKGDCEGGWGTHRGGKVGRKIEAGKMGRTTYKTKTVLVRKERPKGSITPETEKKLEVRKTSPVKPRAEKNRRDFGTMWQ